MASTEAVARFRHWLTEEFASIRIDKVSSATCVDEIMEILQGDGELRERQAGVEAVLDRVHDMVDCDEPRRRGEGILSRLLQPEHAADTADMGCYGEFWSDDEAARSAAGEVVVEWMENGCEPAKPKAEASAKAEVAASERDTEKK